MSIDLNKVNALVQALKDVFENKQTNKKDDISGDFSSDTVSYPTVKAVKTWTSNYSLTTHTHGDISSDGKIGSTSGKPIITTTGGKLSAGAFGTSSGQFAEGNHTHSTYRTQAEVDSQIDDALDAITTALSS